MTLPPSDAEQVLLTRYGEPAKEATDYVIGFQTPKGKVLAIHRTTQETRIWFQPPVPPTMDGITLLDQPNNGNSNINGPLAPLRRPGTLRVEVDSPSALTLFLDWYDGFAVEVPVSTDPLRGVDFGAAFARFQDLLTRFDEPFTRFDEGLIAAWESYKPRVRRVALDRMKAEDWTPEHIGSGEIVARVISAIEIQATHGELTNNMVLWQNRFGHAKRDHRALLEAATTGKGLATIERLLFQLYRSDSENGETFEALSEATGAKYPLMAYLFFLKDIDRFMPIQPTGFDRVFGEIGLDFRTLRQCSWQNYSEFNSILDALRAPIADVTGLNDVRLVDAHSFLWLFSTLLRKEAKGELDGGSKAG